MEIRRKKVHYDVNGEETINKAIKHEEKVLDLGSRPPLVAHLNRQLYAAVNGEENNEDVPLDAAAIVQLDEPLRLPQLLLVRPLLFLLLHFLPLLVAPILQAFDHFVVAVVVSALFPKQLGVQPSAPSIFQTLVEVGCNALPKRLVALLYFHYEDLLFDLHDVPRLLFHLFDFSLVRRFKLYIPELHLVFQHLLPCLLLESFDVLLAVHVFRVKLDALRCVRVVFFIYLLIATYV